MNKGLKYKKYLRKTLTDNIKNSSILVMVAKMYFVSDIIESMKANRLHLENFIS